VESGKSFGILVTPRGRGTGSPKSHVIADIEEPSCTAKAANEAPAQGPYFKGF